MRIGFIGLGVMGAPMAGHLAAAGHEIVTVRRAAGPPPGLSATVRTTPAEVAAEVDVVITMLPDTPDVEKVLVGQDGVIDGIAAGKLVIDMSSISPGATRAIAERFAARNVACLDAPVSGGEVGAKAASLTIMVGGPREAFDRAMPLFGILGRSITLVGERNGSGQVCKIANQIVVALTIEAVAEALVLAVRAGCDPASVRAALLGGFAGSRVLEVHGQRMIDRAFAPGFRMRLHQKDLRLALDSAAELGVALPNTTQTAELMRSCASRPGGAEADHSSLILALEALLTNPPAKAKE